MRVVRRRNSRNGAKWNERGKVPERAGPRMTPAPEGPTAVLEHDEGEPHLAPQHRAAEAADSRDLPSITIGRAKKPEKSMAPARERV
jgi:hypothetical protein